MNLVCLGYYKYSNKVDKQSGGGSMIQQFLQKFTRKTGKVEQSFEVVSKEHREIKGLSFEQNEDESIVMDF